MSRKTKKQHYAESTAKLYHLAQRWGISSSLWYKLGDFGFKQREVDIKPITWRDKPSGVAQWANHTLNHSMVESKWSYNSPFWRYVVKDSRDIVNTGDRFHDWAVGFANSRAVGGAFLVIRDGTIPIASAHVNKPTRYEGNMTIARVWTSGAVVPPEPNTSITPIGDLNRLGSTAISRILPNNPNANLSQFLGELRERLPAPPLLSVYKDRTDNLVKNAGGEYLNVEFGWKPIADDLVGFAKQIKRSETTLEQFLKDEGKRVRRHYQFPDEKTTQIYDNVTFTTGSTVTGYAFLNGQVTVQTTTKRWLDAAFIYHIPGGSSALEKWREYSAKADRLLGVDLTPELIYNLTPWTWMLDWYGNLGDVMTNISNLGQDSMVMQYGYIMEHKVIRSVYQSSFGGSPIVVERFFESKRRHPATPYGFGVVESDLSLSQQAILAALGMTKAPGKV